MRSLPIASLRPLAPQDRIGAIVDAGSMAPVDAALAAPRASLHLARWGIAAQDDDGIVFARGRVLGRPALIAAQDERFLGGSVGAHHGAALRALFLLARIEQPAAVVLLLASGGVRLYEANPAEQSLSGALFALQDVRVAGIPVLAIGVGDVFGGASVLACAADRLALLPRTLLGLSGPRVIEAMRGRNEIDASDGRVVVDLFGAAARAAAGQAELLADDVEVVRGWIAHWARDQEPFARRVAASQSCLGDRLAAATGAGANTDEAISAGGAERAPPFPGATAVDRDGWLWRARGQALTVAPALGTHAFGPCEAHALDAALLAEFAAPMARGTRTLILVEDSPGHEATRRAEALCVAQYLAQHTAVLALLRSRGVRVLGLLAGTGHSAAFFANALQAEALYAVLTARVIAMDPEAIARVTRLPPSQLARLIEDDPLLGHPVRCFGQWGGVMAIVTGLEALAERVLADRMIAPLSGSPFDTLRQSRSSATKSALTWSRASAGR